MDKEEIKPVKKRSIWDSFTYVFSGFIAVCSVIIVGLAYNKGENIIAIIFSFIAGYVISEIVSLDKTKDWG